MYTEKFLQQVHRKLVEHGITNLKLRDTCIDIYGLRSNGTFADCKLVEQIEML